MNRYPWLDEALLALPGCEKDFKEEWGWHRYQVGGKLFAATCAPGPEHKVVGGHEILSVKCDPQLSELLRSQYPDIVPGFYMDKRCWISILLDGSVPALVSQNTSGWKPTYSGAVSSSSMSIPRAAPKFVHSNAWK